MPVQSRSASVLFCTQVMISVSVHTLTDCFTGISKTRWAFFYPETLFVGGPLPKVLLQNPVYATQIKGSAGLAILDHTVPLGGLRNSSQLKREGTVSSTRFVAASLDVLLILSKSPPDLWALASGPLVWVSGSWQAATVPGFKSKGRAEEREYPSAWERCLYTPVVLLWDQGAAWQSWSLYQSLLPCSEVMC